MSEFKRCEAAGLKVYRDGWEAIEARQVEALLERQEMQRNCVNGLADALKSGAIRERESVEFFRPSDFAHWLKGFSGTSAEIRAAECANRILSQRGTRVYCADDEIERDASEWRQKRYSYDKSTALLVCIEPIQRESEERQLLRAFVREWDRQPIDEMREAAQAARALLDAGPPKG